MIGAGCASGTGIGGRREADDFFLVVIVACPFFPLSSPVVTGFANRAILPCVTPAAAAATAAAAAAVPTTKPLLTFVA